MSNSNPTNGAPSTPSWGWPLIKWLTEFAEGFRPGSWKRSANEWILASLAMFDRVAKAAPHVEVDAERTEALLRSRQPLLLQQEMIDRLAKRIFGLSNPRHPESRRKVYPLRKGGWHEHNTEGDKSPNRILVGELAERTGRVEVVVR